MFQAPKDLRIVLPKRIYGLDVTLHVGERHISDGATPADAKTTTGPGGG